MPIKISYSSARKRWLSWISGHKKEFSNEIDVEGRRVIISDSLFYRTANVDADFYDEVTDPYPFINALKNDGRAVADLFTFMQIIPNTTPQYYGFFMEWDNVAAIPVSTYNHWWTQQVNDKTRNMARKLNKKGGEIRIAEFDDNLVKGISHIYNEVPIRQGKKFWHYGLPLDAIKEEHGTFLDRSIFIGAYYNSKLIGFMKLVFQPSFAGIMYIISMIEHRDKAPTNALIARGVEICAERKIPYLVYAKFVYWRKYADTLVDFKRHNGFVQINLPRYFIPLSAKGRIALKLGLHNGIQGILPQWLVLRLIKIRSKWLIKTVSKH